MAADTASWAPLSATAPSSLTEVLSIDDLPRGVGDEQDAGHYRLTRRDDDAPVRVRRSHAVGKPVFFPRTNLWHGRRNADEGFSVEAAPTTQPPVALLGVRSCDPAVGIHDVVLTSRALIDPRYASRREGTFVVATTCADPAGTCFCASIGTGPKPQAGYDIALTELLDGEHRFRRGGYPHRRGVVNVPQTSATTADDVTAAQTLVAQAVAGMGRTMRTDDLREVLYEGVESPTGTTSPALPGLPELHDGLPHVSARPWRDVSDPRRRRGRTASGLGFLLLPGVFTAAHQLRARLDRFTLPAVDHPQTRCVERPVRDVGMCGVWSLHHLVPGCHRHHRRGRRFARRADGQG